MATTTADLEELEAENESLYAGIEKALKALDDDNPERASEILADLLSEDEPEDQD